MTRHTRRPPPSPAPPIHPGPLRRGLYFVLGAALGGAIGYGMISSGPGPAPSMLDLSAMTLPIGLATACGALAAWSPDRFWRRSRWLVSHPDNDDT
jgi:hypothetical protein